ncbi:MAG: methyltransferase domain-containing protein [Gammaproteobacteria bacterium]|nr:methyltransferase domain-containing protein [Gammaproteobacteria bacterium]
MKLDHGLQEYGWKSADALADHSYTLPAIKSLLPAGKLNILDAGCGNGFVAGQLAEMGHQVTAIDLSDDGIEIARKEYPNVRFEVRSVYDELSDLIDYMDVVVSSEVIEHIYYPQRFLRNLNPIIREGGCLILTTPYHGYIKNLALSIFDKWDRHHTVDWEGGHIKFFSQKTISSMLEESGFGDISFNNAGRVRWLWKSMVCRAQKK